MVAASQGGITTDVYPVVARHGHSSQVGITTDACQLWQGMGIASQVAEPMDASCGKAWSARKGGITMLSVVARHGHGLGNAC